MKYSRKISAYNIKANIAICNEESSRTTVYLQYSKEYNN